MSADDQHNAFDDLSPQEDEATPEPDSDVKADEDAALDFHESAPLEQEAPPANGPASAAPPRIVAEAPLGGVPKPIVPPVPPSDDTTSAAGEVASVEAGEVAPSTDAEEAAPVTEGLSLGELPDVAAGPESGDAAAAVDEPLAPDKLRTVPADVVAEERLTREEGAAPDTPPDERVPVTPPDPDESTIESDALAAEVRRITEKLEDAGEVAASPSVTLAGEVAANEVQPDAPAPAAAPAAPPASRPLPPQPEPVEGVGMADADDFEDISPELAAILGKPAPPAATPTADSAPPAVPSAPDAAAEITPEVAPAPTPTPEPEPAAPPVQLTDIAEVRRLPITAEQRSAPAPNTTLTGKVRYVRVEEPLRNDEGQRTQETWKYLKPDYPALGGRLVKEITIEEIAHSDGSWEWHYERRYTDKGRDRREVRANADRSYIEREDEVSRLDAETGRRLQFREEAELIFAPPEKEERRGGLLGGLFGRGDDDDRADGPKAWRHATPSEAKQARKQGGEAFKRGGFLGL